MIEAIEKNLLRGIKLLNEITDQQYSDCSVAPYYSSIGNNMRHILDVFSCIFKGIDSGSIDFSNRDRNELAQVEIEHGIAYFNDIINRLKRVEEYDLNRIVNVIDDLGTGKVSTKYTLGSALAQAHSHAIHHYASIGFIINSLGIELPDEEFGYNPTTPKVEKLE